MIKVAKIHLNNLRNETHFQYHTEFKDLVTKIGAATLKIQQQFTTYLPLYNIVDEAFKKINKSIFTKQIKDADKARDETWYGFVDAIKSAMRHFDQSMQLSAQKLKIVTDTYGNVAKKSLDAQTAATYNILQELTGKYSADVNKLGLGQWVTELQNRNNVLSALMKERYDETAAKNDTVLKRARAELDKDYRTIIERINALIVVEGEADYEVFAKTLNAVIAKYTAIMKNRKSSKNEPDSENDDSEQGDET